MKIKTFLLVVIVSFLVAGCSEKSPEQSVAIKADFQKQLQEKLITASVGDVITIPEGKFSINRGLSIKVDKVTLKGAGMDKSILSFKDQTQGAEGLMVTADSVTLEDFAVEDAKGDGIKMNQCKDLTVRNVRVEWTDGPNVNNGAYGLYPVQCENVLIDGGVAIGASDAGIYVGQSNNVIVKNSRAEYNVAGIEIENTTNADVFNNAAISNTGGILIFNMPNLPQQGAKTRVFKNHIVGNNTPNFAPKGTTVAGVPTGSGVMINANDQVEIFDNEIANNRTANIIVSSYFSAGDETDRLVVENFDPYPEGIYIYDNDFRPGGSEPGRDELVALKNAMFGEQGHFPDVIWDGYVNAKVLVDGVMPDEKRICLNNGDAELLNVDAPNDYAKPTVGKAAYQCELVKLPAISF